MSPISPISVVGAVVAFPNRCCPRPVEPVCPKQPDPAPANPFTIGPVPFDMFLQKLNALDRFDRDLPPVKACGYTSSRKAACKVLWNCETKGSAQELGARIDVIA